jgi:hypothetical protein
MPTHAPHSRSGAERLFVMVMSWLIPGYGYWHFGLRARAVIVFVVLEAVFLAGAFLRGSLLLPEMNYRSPDFNLVAVLTVFTQSFNGLLSFVSLLPEIAGGFHILPYDETNQWSDLGSFYLLVSGGMNYFVLVSVWDNFLSRRTEQVAEQGDPE